MPAPPPPWKRWYKTARWQALRLRIFLRDTYQCQRKECGKVTAHPVCDHVRPHRGDEALFWDEGNLQTLCKPCHDGLKQKEEQASLHTRGNWGHSDTNLFWPRLQPSTAKLTIVCGPPAAGKSTLIRNIASEGDQVIDLDDIIAELFKGYSRTRTWEMRRAGLRERNDRLQALAATEPHATAWFLTGAPKPNDRMRWYEMLQPARLILMATPLDVCIERINADPERAIGAKEQIEAATQWWSDYSPAVCDEIV